jgi:hypothetical protein
MVGQSIAPMKTVRRRDIGRPSQWFFEEKVAA